MINADCHTHTCFSSDSKAAPADMAEGAAAMGLKVLCVTDHFDYLYPHEIEGGFVFDLGAYEKSMTALRDDFDGRIRINIGIELGLRSEKQLRGEVRARYRELLSAFNFDFVIGSTHVLDNEDPYLPSFWERRGIGRDEGLRMYFEAIRDNIAYYDGLFDSCGHLDYLVRYVPGGERDYCASSFSDITDEILKLLISSGTALECNTAGLKYGLGFAHPKEEIVRRYLELGGELLTIGSDAHEPGHLAYGFDRVCGWLRSLGARYYTVYTGRRPVQHTL